MISQPCRILLVGSGGAKHGKQGVGVSVIARFPVPWPEALTFLLGREIRKWLSPPDPRKNYNITRESLHEGTARWFTEGDIFAEWKATSSLLWIHGKRLSISVPPFTQLVKLVTQQRDLARAS
jgi:hypothetical protein